MEATATRKPRAKQSLQVVRAGEAYPLGVFARMVGRGVPVLHELRTMKQLPMTRSGNFWWVLGEDWLAYLRAGRGTD